MFETTEIDGNKNCGEQFFTKFLPIETHKKKKQRKQKFQWSKS